MDIALEQFSREKRTILERADLSKKGSIDAEISDIVSRINEKADFCTTSSCAGRITLLERKSSKKIDARWLLASHQPVQFKEVKEKMKSEHDVWLMQESCILHVFCRTLEAAQRFLHICHAIGFKRSGIITTRHIMIEMMGSEKVEAIVIKQGKALIDDTALSVYIDECNTRMLRNRKRMEEFHEALNKL